MCLHAYVFMHRLTPSTAQHRSSSIAASKLRHQQHRLFHPVRSASGGSPDGVDAALKCLVFLFNVVERCKGMAHVHDISYIAARDDITVASNTTREPGWLVPAVAASSSTRRMGHGPPAATHWQRRRRQDASPESESESESVRGQLKSQCGARLVSVRRRSASTCGARSDSSCSSSSLN